MRNFKVTTGAAVLSYAHIFEPREDLNGNLKYSCSLIFPKQSNTPGIIKRKMEEMLEDEDVKKVLGKGRNFTHPLLRDGDEERPEDTAYKGSFFMKAKSNPDHKPKLFNRDRSELVDPEELYSGCWVQAVLTLFPYNKKGSKGISASLVALRKLKDGKPLSGTAVTDADFDDSLISDLDELF